MRKLGSLEPVIYFVNHRDQSRPLGHILLAPYSQFPTPDDYSREGAGTLAEVDALQKRLVEQEQREWEQQAQAEEELSRRTDDVRDRLYTRMVSSSTTEYEREFIRLYLQLREEKRAKYRQRFFERNAYLWAREHDIPKGRGADEESVNLDRINF